MMKAKAIVEQDLVLIHIDDNPAFYARVEQIEADVKPKWWRVKFLFLTVPPRLATWIIDEEQIRGADFTMGGTPLRIEKVVVPEDAEEDMKTEAMEPEEESGHKPKQARVLSLDRKKQKNRE